MACSRVNTLRASRALLAMEKTFPMEISDGENRPFWWGNINRIGFWFLFFTICSLFARHRGWIALQGLISPKLCTTASWKPLWDRSGDTAHPILAMLLMQQAETQVPYACRVWGYDGKGGLDSHGQLVSRQQWAGLPGGGKILGAMKHDRKACQWLVQEVGMLLKGGKRAAGGGRPSKGGGGSARAAVPTDAPASQPCRFSHPNACCHYICSKCEVGCERKRSLLLWLQAEAEEAATGWGSTGVWAGDACSLANQS